MRYIPNNIHRLYLMQPGLIKNMFNSLYWFLKKKKEYNKRFYEYLNEAEMYEYYSKEKLLDIQSERIREIIKYSYENVPYYHKLFDENNITPSQIQNYNDLKKIPVLDKETLRDNFNNLISRQYIDKKYRIESTSGTTGKPLSIAIDNDAFLHDAAYGIRNYKWANYNLENDWFAKLAGHKVIDINQKKPPFGAVNYLGKQIHLSAYHLSEENAKYYFDIIRKKKVKYLSGYPSAIGLLAEFFRRNGFSYKLDGIFYSSEPILIWQIDAINDVFDCEIYGYYSQAERALSASGCGYGLNMHINVEISAFNLINENSNRILVGTSLLNKAMPLINYKLNDITDGVIDEDCSCGRSHPRLKPVTSKNEDFIVTPEGRYISASLITFAFKKPKGVYESQIIQKDYSTIDVSIVPEGNFNYNTTNNIRNDLQSILGNKIKINFNIVESIPRTKNGKFRFVKSLIKH